MGEVVHRVDTPRRTGLVMLRVPNAVQHGVAQPDVGRGHVDARAQRARAIGELARLHAREQVEALGYGARAERAVLAGLVGRAAIGLHLGGRQVAHIRLAQFDQPHGELVQRAKIVGGIERRTRGLERQALVRPTVDQPLQVRGDRVDILDIFLGRVGVVHPQVAAPAKLPRDAEVQADRLGVADVQVAVRLRRETREHGRLPARGQVLLNDLADEIEMLGSVGFGGGGRGIVRVRHGASVSLGGQGLGQCARVAAAAHREQ